MPPTVSIILPTYNRARFLPQAFESIRTQTFQDWELIVVDDGSTDTTRDVVERLARGTKQSVRYQYQENQGPAAARNAGVDLACGAYVAFLDSDDFWLPHHLADCVAALAAHPDIDWVYTATRMVDMASGHVINENVFFPPEGPRLFLSLATAKYGNFNVLDDARTVECALADALWAGLQTSLLRARVVQRVRLPLFRVGEDQLFAILAVKAGYRLAYTHDVHVVYHVHEGGVSASSRGTSQATVGAIRELVKGFEWLRTAIPLTRRESKVLRRRLANDYCWNLAYRLQATGSYRPAREMFRQALAHCPSDWRIWKAYWASFPKQLQARLSSARNTPDDERKQE